MNPRDWRSDDYIALVFTAVLLSLVGTGLYCLFKMVAASGEVTYCYVSHNESSQSLDSWVVWGHRDWRPDRVLHIAGTSQDATAAKDKVCTK